LDSVLLFSWSFSSDWRARLQVSICHLSLRIPSSRTAANPASIDDSECLFGRTFIRYAVGCMNLLSLCIRMVVMVTRGLRGALMPCRWPIGDENLREAYNSSLQPICKPGMSRTLGYNEDGTMNEP